MLSNFSKKIKSCRSYSKNSPSPRGEEWLKNYTFGMATANNESSEHKSSLYFGGGSIKKIINYEYERDFL